jgi:hypothetical protein
LHPFHHAGFDRRTPTEKLSRRLGVQYGEIDTAFLLRPAIQIAPIQLVGWKLLLQRAG